MDLHMYICLPISLYITYAKKNRWTDHEGNFRTYSFHTYDPRRGSCFIEVIPDSVSGFGCDLTHCPLLKLSLVLLQPSRIPTSIQMSFS